MLRERGEPNKCEINVKCESYGLRKPVKTRKKIFNYRESEMQ